MRSEGIFLAYVVWILTSIDHHGSHSYQSSLTHPSRTAILFEWRRALLP